MDNRRLVMEFEDGQMTFRRFSFDASYEQLLNLATALNRFQEDEVKRVLLVTVRQF